MQEYYWVEEDSCLLMDVSLCFQNIYVTSVGKMLNYGNKSFKLLWEELLLR